MLDPEPIEDDAYEDDENDNAPRGVEPLAIEEARAAFVRWQGNAMKQLGYLNNLLIALSAGLLAFQTNLAFDDKYGTKAAAERTLIVTSAAFAFLSAAVGIFVAWNRLGSNRITARIARIRMQIARIEGGQKREPDGNAGVVASPAPQAGCTENVDAQRKPLEDERTKLRDETRLKDWRTKVFLNAQVLLFALGVVFVMIVSLRRYLR